MSGHRLPVADSVEVSARGRPLLGIRVDRVGDLPRRCARPGGRLRLADSLPDLLTTDARVISTHARCRHELPDAAALVCIGVSPWSCHRGGAARRGASNRMQRHRTPEFSGSRVRRRRHGGRHQLRLDPAKERAVPGWPNSRRQVAVAPSGRSGDARCPQRLGIVVWPMPRGIANACERCPHVRSRRCPLRWHR